MKKVTLIFILTMLFLPLLMQMSGRFKGRELEGLSVHAKKPVLTAENYFEGFYQDSMNKYLDENFGLRNYLVRGYNQMLYSVFGKTFAPRVVVGKNGILFMESYITSYTGINYIGEEKIFKISHKIKLIQDLLKLQNKDIIVVLAPGKGSLYPEYIPDSYFYPHHPENNYQGYKRAFDKYHVQYLDLNSVFVGLKNKSKYPLFPRYGSHWNAYGVAVATDTLIHFIEKLRNIDMPDMKYDEVILSSSIDESEYDIGILLNIYNTLPDTLPYPQLEFVSNDQTTKPSALVVGDSYWWCMVGGNIPGRIFKENEYWFYYKDVLINGAKQSQGAAEKDIREEILKRDVIILMATEATLNVFPYGFIERAYSKFYLTKEERIKEIIQEMDKNKEWMEYIKQNAIKNNVTLDQQKRSEAEYLYGEENKKRSEDRSN